jgi:hypothetical protein
MENERNECPLGHTERAARAELARRRAMEAIANSERLINASQHLMPGPTDGAPRRYRVMRDFERMTKGEFVAEEHLPAHLSREALLAEGFLMEDDYRLEAFRLELERTDDGWMA